MQEESNNKVVEDKNGNYMEVEHQEVTSYAKTDEKKELKSELKNPCYFWSMCFFVSIGMCNCAMQSEWLGPFVRTIPKGVNHNWSEHNEGLYMGIASA